MILRGTSNDNERGDPALFRTGTTCGVAGCRVEGSGIRGQLGFRLLYHSTLGSRVIKKKKKVQGLGVRG